MPRRTRKLPYKKNITRKKRGGQGKYKTNSIPNIEIIIFLIDFLNENKEKLNQIMIANYSFIDSIIEYIDNQKLKFEENAEFRKFISDISLWILLDYDKTFFNAILEIVKNTIDNENFLDVNKDTEERYDILLSNVNDMIGKFDVDEDIHKITLLKIILKVLQRKNIEDTIMTNINEQRANILNFKNSISCLLDNIIKKDLFHNEEIRILIKEIIENLTYRNVFEWSTLTQLIGLVSGCAGSITVEALPVVTENIKKKATGAIETAKGKISNTFSQATGFIRKSLIPQN